MGSPWPYGESLFSQLLHHFPRVEFAELAAKQVNPILHNQHHPAELFEDLFWILMHRFRASIGLGRCKHNFRFKYKWLNLDSTTIALCLNMFPWAKFRHAKGGVKVHVLLNLTITCHHMPGLPRPSVMTAPLPEIICSSLGRL